jgi:tripartite-type tricarboxylate transporter receptor subunit TctC
MKRRTILQAPALLCLATGARAQSFPTKPIRYIVPVAAGGGNDMIARVVTERWGKALGQNFIVENQGGGGGVIASVATARAAPDGYTLMQGYVATHGTTPATRKVPYDAIKDFTPIGMIGGTPNVLVVNSALPVKTLAEFIDHLKKNPGRLSYGSAGQGSLTHLTMELFKQQIGAFMLHIPYRGIAPAFTDLLGGQTQAMFPGLAAALPHLRSGACARSPSPASCAATSSRTCRRSRSRASRGSMRSSGTARSARRACRPTWCAISTKRRSRC